VSLLGLIEYCIDRKINAFHVTPNFSKLTEFTARAPATRWLVSSNASPPRPSARSAARGLAPTRQTWVVENGKRRLWVIPVGYTCGCRRQRRCGSWKRPHRRNQTRRGLSSRDREAALSHWAGLWSGGWPHSCGLQRGRAGPLDHVQPSPSGGLSAAATAGGRGVSAYA